MRIPPYFLLLAVAIPGVMLQTSEDIPVVHVNQIRTFKGPGMTLRWDPVKTTDKNNPVIGIKIKVWKTPCVIKTYLSTSQNGTFEIVESVRETYNKTTVPSELPEYVVIVKADELSGTVPHIELEQWYHVRVLAFTATAEGRYSDASDFKLISDNEEDKKKWCERIISKTPYKSKFYLDYSYNSDDSDDSDNSDDSSEY